MSDLQTLHDAFAELEHRADLAELDRRVSALAPRRRRVLPWTPVAAIFAAVVALVVGAVWFAPSDHADPPAGAKVAVGPPTTHQALADRFRRVLGDTATFTVSENKRMSDVITTADPDPGLSIAGPVSSNGVDGWFQLTIYPNRPCSFWDASCRTPMSYDVRDRVTHIKDGSVTARMSAYGALRVSADGNTLLQLMVSDNDRTLGKPPTGPVPLDGEQIARIVSSDLWW